MPKWNGRWKGGRTYEGRRGETCYYLDQTYGKGKRFGKKLDVRNEQDAEAELALFNRDPERYVAQAAAKAAPAEADEEVVLDEALIDRFCDHLRRLGRDERNVRGVGSYLRWWRGHLKGRDLRKVRLRELRAALETEKTALRHRIVTYKVLCSFLRGQGLLTRQEDASLDLKAPPPRPEKATREKGYTMEQVELFYRAINLFRTKRGRWTGRTVDAQSVRDCMVLHAKLGMHHTEVERLARGLGRVTELQGQGEIAGTLYFLHKSGYEHTVSVDLQTLRAAQRLQARGKLPTYFSILRFLIRAARELDVEPVLFGELRHSFVGWARTHGKLVRPAEAGVALDEIAGVLGHTNVRTTKMFYDPTKVPPMIKVPINLWHPDDPPVDRGVVLSVVR